MTPVYQNILYGKDAIGNGNCLAACLASIFDLPLWMVPPFEQMFGRNDWFTRINEWTMHTFNLMLYQCDEPTDELPEFYIACGPSLRGVSHAVVYSKGGLVHDPHHSGSGLMGLDWVWYFDTPHCATPEDTVDDTVRPLQDSASAG